MSDASDVAVGWVAFMLPLHFLMDLDKLDLPKLSREGTAKLVAVGSKRLTGHEKQYISFDKEGFGVFTALSKCRPYIRLAAKTILFTDNKTALTRFREGGTDVDVNLTRGRRWIRWANDLSDIIQGPRPVIMRHISGPDNTIADYMSRYCLRDLGLVETSIQTDPSDSFALLTLDDGSSFIQNVGTLDEFDPTITTALKDWTSDPNSEYIKRIKLLDIWNQLQGHEVSNSNRQQLIQASKRFHVVDSILYMKYKGTDTIVVPDTTIPLRRGDLGGRAPNPDMNLRNFLAKYFHEGFPAAHRGQISTLSAVRRLFWWPAMDLTISSWINTCLPCQITQARTGRHTTDFRHRVVSGPNVLLIVDWIGPMQPNKDNHKHILVMICGFSGFTMCKPFASKDSANTCTGILEWSSLFGIPRYWASDRDSTLIGKVCTDLRKVLKIRDIDSPAYCPMTQGVVERRVQDLKRCIEKFTNDSDSDIDWSDIVRLCVWSCNTTERFQNLSPFEVLFGRPPYSPLGVSLGGYSLNHEGLLEGETICQYAQRLKSYMSEIREYWFSKVMEARSRSNDHASLTHLPSPDLRIGDKCLRVKYFNGRREVAEVVLIIDKRDSLFVCQQTHGNQVLCNGYQLIKLNERNDPTEILDSDDTLEQLRVRSVQRELRNRSPGDFVATIYNNSLIYVGQLQQIYINGSECEILFWVPVGNNKFRIPVGREIDRWAEITPIGDIISTDVQVEYISDTVISIPTGQFGGSVA